MTNVYCACGNLKPSGYGECFYCVLRDSTIGVETAGGKLERIAQVTSYFSGGGRLAESPLIVSNAGLPKESGCCHRKKI